MNGSAYYTYQAKARGLNTSSDVERLTDQLAPVYDRLLANALPAEKDAPIYEVACGPGIVLRYLRRRGYTSARGSDSSSCQIALARSASLNVVEADSLVDLSTHQDHSLACIFAIDFVEHVPKDALIQFYSLAQSKLRPGGVLILREPNGDSPFVGRNIFNDITHYWAYTTIATGGLLRMAGFHDIQFLDESVASLERMRWLKVPIMRLTQAMARFLIRMLIRDEIHYFSPSIYVIGRS